MISSYLLVCLTVLPGSADSLDRAGPNADTWLRALTATAGPEHEWTCYLLEELPELDLMEADETTILNHVRLTAASLRFHTAYVLPEDTLRRYLLWPVAGHREHISDWRPALQAALAPYIGDGAADTADSVLSYLDRIAITEQRRDLFGPRSPPLGTFRRGWGTPREVAALKVAALRSVGIAARLAPGATSVEVWAGDAWRRAGAGSHERSESRYEAAAARLELRLTLGGRPFLKPDNIGLARWLDGRWKEAWPPEFPIEVTTTDSSLVCHVPPGDYLFTAGVRNAVGEPRVWCQSVTLDGASEVTVDQCLDIPFAELSRADLVRGALPNVSSLRFTDRLSEERTAEGVLSTGPLVLALLDPSSEPSLRVAEGFSDVRENLESLGATLWLVTVGGDSQPLRDPEGAVAGSLGLTQREDGSWSGLPLVLVLSEEGELLMRRSGYDLTLPQLALQCLLAQRHAPRDN
jgi:hypothetical protein